MNAEDIFRGALVRAEDGHRAEADDDETGDEVVCLADEIDAVLYQGSKCRRVNAHYETPAGDQRFLAITVSPVPAASEGLLGVACLINDLTELESIRHQQELHGEISAEMARQLRASLATISGYAQQLANNRDPELAQQLAADIAEEAARLDSTLGGFLTEKRSAQSAATGAAG